MSKQLKMYIWEDVLKDYTSGLVCILAHDLEEAMEVAKKKFTSYVVDDFAGQDYEVVTKPDGFYVYGGG